MDLDFNIKIDEPLSQAEKINSNKKYENNTTHSIFSFDYWK